jgi:hypothetical protein
MAAGEEIVSELVMALRVGEQMLASRTRELLRLEGWSGVTFQFGLGEWSDSEASDPRGRLGFTGYVDGELADVGGVAWMFDLIRDGHGWTVKRGLYLNANTTGYQETVAELPAVACVDSRQLAARLPALVTELLEMPAPHAAAP